MIIPTGTSNNYKIGDNVILTKDVVLDYAIFCKGHEFEIYDTDNFGYILKDDDIFLDKINDSYFTLKISLEQAKNEVHDRTEYLYYKNYLSRNCPHRTDGYADRDSYDVCEIKQKDRTIYDDTCTPCSACVQYVKLDKRTKQHVRKMKLNEIKIKLEEES